MPFYEYKCLECDKIFEIMHGVNDDSPTDMENCEEKLCRLQRIISAANFKIKGAGSRQQERRSGYLNFTPNMSQNSSYSPDKK